MRLFALFLAATLAITPSLSFAQTADSAMASRLVQGIESMTPAQREAAFAQAQSVWQNMTPAQQDAVKNQALQKWQNLSPQKKQQITAQALQKWQSLTPEQQAQLRNRLTAPVQTTPAPARR